MPPIISYDGVESASLSNLVADNSTRLGSGATDASWRQCTAAEKLQHSDCFEMYNQGECVAMLPPKYPFSLLCRCKTDFTGTHCGILSGMSLSNQQTTAVILGVCFFVLLVCAALFGVWYLARRRSQKARQRVQAQERLQKQAPSTSQAPPGGATA